jgi:nickel/cobalt transporter (NicO) family protein
MRVVLVAAVRPGGMFEATQAVAGVSLDLLGTGLIKLLRLQREIQRSLASEFMATRDSTGLLRPTLLMAMAFAFGAVHAATPGHGKSIVMSYFLGQGGVARRGVTMSAKVIVTHVLSAIALVTATTFVIDLSLGMRPADFPAVRLISYAGVTLVGSWLLWRAVRRQGGMSLDAPATREGALPYFAGMSPCPLTTIIMVAALANGMVFLGLLVSLSMALGMIATVSLFALAVILCRRWLLDFLRRHAAHVERIARSLEILGAAAVTVIGLLLFSSELV